MTRAALTPLPDGRLRVEKGPLSMVIAARWGADPRGGPLLDAGSYALELLDVLAAHRRLLAVDARRIRNAEPLPPVVRAMWAAAARFPDRFVTPLVAVAGAVADFVAEFLVRQGASWVVVSNGGDVAVRLAPGERASVGVVDRVSAARPARRFRVGWDDGVGGIATSGFGGRSLTLGIADAVTVAASTAVVADACATLVANEVTVESPAVRRAPAEKIDPGTDLAGHQVTVAVGHLAPAEIEAALDRGEAEARAMLAAGHIRGAVLALRGRWRFVGWPGEERVQRLANPHTQPWGHGEAEPIPPRPRSLEREVAMEIRKIVTIVEETRREAGRDVTPPTRRAAAMAVIRNPFAGRYVEDLTELMDVGAELGRLLGEKTVAALGIAPEQAESYGKGAIVGTDGELEHAAAILHPKLGKPFRETVGGGKAIIPSAKKMGIPGTELDVPLHYKDAAFVRSHFDAMPVRVYDAPRPDEIVVALVVTDSGRPLPRVGGLTKEEAKKEDGLR